MQLSTRLAKALFFRLCARIEVGSLHVTLPDGSDRSFEPRSGRKPLQHAEFRVHDETLFRDILTQGDWGLGWGYVDGKWDSEDPYRVPLLFMLNERVFRPWVRAARRLSPTMQLAVRRSRANQNRDEAARRRTVGECYDVGNDFFSWMLGPSMVYTCAIWPRPDATLEEAQENKLRIVTDKARIEPQHRVLDLGCGWGTLCSYIQQRTGARVTGIALAREQVEWARAHHPQCEFEYQNYENIEGQYDRIVSVGMTEHVGRPNLAAFLQLVSDHLAPGGRFVMHTMLSQPGVLMESESERWTSFASVAMPNGDVPSLSDLVRASLSIGKLRIVHTETYGIHYARTGRAWLANTIANRDRIVAKYSEEFYRTYVYSWSMGSAAFETGMTLGHVVFENQPYGSPYTHSLL